MAERPPGFDDQTLVEFLIDCCLVTRTTGPRRPRSAAHDLARVR